MPRHRGDRMTAGGSRWHIVASNDVATTGHSVIGLKEQTKMSTTIGSTRIRTTDATGRTLIIFVCYDVQ